jgi:hypothetical protein
MPSPRPLLGALAAAALLVAGCGSSGDDAKPAAAKPATATPAAATPQPTGPRPTRAAYTRRADKLCRAARTISEQANTAVQQAFAAKQTVAAADAIDHYGPLFGAKVKELEALPRPATQGKVLAAFMKVLDAQVTALASTSTALRSSDSAALKQLGQFEVQTKQYAETLGKQYGFTVCGRAA